MLTTHGTLIQSYGDGGRWFGPVGNMIKAAAMNPFLRQTLKAFVAKVNTQALESVRELIESSRLTPVIDRRFPLGEAGTAVRLVEDGSPQGKVVITV